MTSKTYWAMLDTDHPDAVKGIAELASWSLNYDQKDPNPFQFFLDIIGWSDEELGGNICDSIPKMGFVEIDYLADALREYSIAPDYCLDWINKLLAEEQKDDHDSN